MLLFLHSHIEPKRAQLAIPGVEARRHLQIDRGCLLFETDKRAIDLAIVHDWSDARIFPTNTLCNPWFRHLEDARPDNLTDFARNHASEKTIFRDGISIVHNDGHPAQQLTNGHGRFGGRNNSGTENIDRTNLRLVNWKR